jgi:hypothetical protein
VSDGCFNERSDFRCSECRCPPGRTRLPVSPARRVSLLEGSVLRAPGLVDKEAAGEAGSGTDSGAEPGVPANGADNRTHSGPSRSAGERALLGRSHVGAGDDWQSESSDYQKLFHEIPRDECDQCDVGHG